MRTLGYLLRAILLGALLSTALFAAGDSKKNYDIPAGDAAAALKHFSATSGRETLFAAEAVRGVKTPAVSGELTVQEALDALLADTGLIATVDKESGAIAVRRETAAESKNGPSRLADAETADAQEERSGRVEDGVLKLGRFDVFGSKLINLDVPRTRDDVQPYVVFDAAQIQNSQATNLGDFFRTRLPMASPPGPTGAVAFAPLAGGVTSSVNLRGLGTNQTLILVDGRPVPGTTIGGSHIGQPDLNGIPLSMIERVEILPSTASGIYGGGATGGVINIITRKDFSGAVLTLNYANTFDTDSAQRRVDFNASTSLRGGATVLTLTASYGDANDIRTGDRDFAQRARDVAFANNPALFTGTTTPPRGYTTNIRNSTSANLILKPQYGGTVLSSPFTHVPVGYAGITSDNAAALVANAGRYNLALPNDHFSRQSRLSTLNSPSRSLGVGVRQKLAPWLEGYADYQLNRHQGQSLNLAGASTTATLAATAPNNPFTTAVRVAIPLPGVFGTGTNLYENTRVSSGLVAKLPGGWQAAFDYTWGRSALSSSRTNVQLGDPDGFGPGLSYTAALANGTLDVLRDINAQPLNLSPYLMPSAVSNYEEAHLVSITQSATLRASGPVFRLPVGDIVVSASADWRADKNPDSFIRYWDGFSTNELVHSFLPSTSANNRSAYAEARVPVLAPRAGMTQPLLEVQVAGRYDKSRVKTYSDTFLPEVLGANGPYDPVTYLTRQFSDTTYTAGLRFAPLPDLALRVSAGTGFLAPARAQMNAGITRPGFPITVVDPKRGGVSSTAIVTLLATGNADLRPEKSESLSAGAIFTPRILPGLRLSVDYTRIEKTDEITGLTIQQIFLTEDFLPGLITRAPLTPADQALGYTGGVVTQVDARFTNIARRKVEAVDLQADYTRKFALGEFHFYGVATWNRSFSAQVSPTATTTESVGFFDGPLKWSGHGGIDWSRGPWSAGWNVHYYGEQLIYASTGTTAANDSATLTHGTDRYSGQFYHDVQVAYQFPRAGEGWRRLFSDLRVSVGLQNAFNSEPPLRPGTGLTGGFQPSEDPRLRRYSLNLQKRF